MELVEQFTMVFKEVPIMEDAEELLLFVDEQLQEVFVTK